MLLFLLVFELILISVTVLCHIMIEKKYKEIERGASIYTDKRAYRTQSSVAFMDHILKRYQEYAMEEGEVPDLYSMIKANLLKEYIGKFTFIGVNNVANKAKYIMWGIIALELVIALINNITTSLEGIFVIASSILLTLGIEIYTIVKALEEKKEATIVLVEDYILNTYPLQINKQMNKQMKLYTSNKEKIVVEKITKEKGYAETTQKEDSQKELVKTKKNDKKRKKKGEMALTEKDIAKFIKNLNKSY